VVEVGMVEGLAIAMPTPEEAAVDLVT